MANADLEYRAYDGAPLNDSIVHLAMTLVVNPFLKGLKLNTREPLKAQLEHHLGTLVLPQYLEQFVPLLSGYVDMLDPELRLPRVEDIRLMQGSFGYQNLSYKIRVDLDGDWEIVFPSDTFGLMPGTTTPLHAGGNQIRFMITLDRLVLQDFGVDIQYWNPFANFPHGDWRRLRKIDLLDGSKMSGIHAKISLSPEVTQPLYEIIAGSGQRFRGVTVSVADVDLSNDHTDFDVGGDVPDWIIDGLNYVATHVYGGLNFYQAIANKLLRDMEEKAKSLPFDIPTLLDFPVVATYGKAFGRPPTEQVTFKYRPEIDIVGSAANNVRAIHFRHRETGHHPPVDPGGLFDPNRFTSVLDRLRDSINVNGMLVDLFDVHVPTPIPDAVSVPRARIDAVVKRFAEPRFQSRDESLMHLIGDRVPVRVVSGLRWDQVDLEAQTIHVADGRQGAKYKISQESVKALRGLQRQRPKASQGPREAQGEPSQFVFTTPEGWHVDGRGVTSLWLSYRALVGLWDRLGDVIGGTQPAGPPLPNTIGGHPGDPAAALGYAVNFVVPNVQFGFLHAAGGFNLGRADLPSDSFVGVYPGLPAGQVFGVTVTTPPQSPVVNFFTNERPRLDAVELPTEIRMTGSGQAPLQARINIAAGLKPDFLQCPDCVKGQEETFLALVQNLACLAEMGLIELTGSVYGILQCLIHPYPIVLRHDGSLVVEAVSVITPGTFPAGSPEELRALLTATLPTVLEQMIPVPVLFDLFHPVPLPTRDRDNEVLGASQGWMTLVQPIKIPQPS